MLKIRVLLPSALHLTNVEMLGHFSPPNARILKDVVADNRTLFIPSPNIENKEGVA